MKELRPGDYKLGRIHGRLNPKNTKSEAAIQRIVYQCSVIRIIRSHDEKKNTEIRLIAYEMPLGKYRDWCVDLMGYDKDNNLWIIEIKKNKNTEKLDDVITQVNNYENAVFAIKAHLESDFKQAFYLEIKFKEVKKLILAPSEFYAKKNREEFKDKTIEYAYFKNKNITDKQQLWNSVDARIEPKSR